MVAAAEPEWTTSAREVTDLAIESIVAEQVHGPVTMGLAEVLVTHQVVGYLRTLHSGEVLDAIELDLPPQRLHTRAVYFTLAPELVPALSEDRLPGALHAAEHAAIGLLPLVATCDRWDVGGVSTALHRDTGLPTVFVYDGNFGGAGFADRGFARLRIWLRATREAIIACTCTHGCPSCIQSPKCGNGNHPLDKEGALLVLDAVLEELHTAP